MDMKTPFVDDISLEIIMSENFFNIYNFKPENIKRLNSFLEDVPDPIKLIPNENISLNYLINLTLLLTNENINFIYDDKFIIEAKKILFKKNTNINIINRDPIALKIMKELIYNYKKFLENDLITPPKNNNTDENSIKNIEREIDKMYKDLRIFINLPKNIFDLDIVKYRSLLLINSFKEKKFKNYEDMYNILVYLDIGYSCLGEETLSEIKSIINSDLFMNDYLLTVDDYLNEEKINVIYFLLTYILNGTSDFKDFTFIIKTRQTLSELLKVKIKENLISNISSEGTRNRFEAIINIFLKYKEKEEKIEKQEEKEEKEEKNINKKEILFNYNDNNKDKSTSNITESFSYIKVKIIKKGKKKKVKEKYYSSTIIRENSDISYQNIELLKLIEKNKSLLIYPHCSLET